MKRKLINMALVLAGAFTLASCSEDNEFPWDGTDKGATVLEAFGPKVNRRGDMTIIGKNLQNVQAVIFPESIRVTDIERISDEKIRVVVPYEAAAGRLTLELAGGKTIVSASEIVYVETFAPPTVSMGEGVESVRSGDEITIDGDYLYNVATVSFAGNADVAADDEEMIVSIDRHRIVVRVPKQALSGSIKIADAEGINVYSENEIVVRQPVIEKMAPLTVKAGEKITITGSDVDLIESVTFADGSKTDAVEVVDRKSVRVEVPATATDGTIRAVSYAGVETESEDALTLTLPTGLRVEAADRFKAGSEVTVSGKDLDLVTALSFASAEAAFDYDAESGSLTAAIPSTAVDGALTLTLANGTTVETEAVELVKAEVAAVSPTELVAGGQITVTGSDLDLITEVKINGAAHEFTATQTSIVITTGNTSQSGKITLAQQNGVKVEPTDEVHFTYDSFVVVNSAPDSAAIGDEITITGSNFNMIEAILFGEAKVTSYTKREDTEMSFLIPSNVETGSYPMTFRLTTGEEETSPQTIEIRGAIATTVIWEGSASLGTAWDWNAGVHIYDQSLWRKIAVGATLNFDFACDTAASTYWQLKLLANGSMPPSFPGNEWGVAEMQADDTTYSIRLTQEDFDLIWAGGLDVVGYALDIKKIYVTWQTSSTEPVYFTDLMLVDYEEHGNHNGSFDGSWGGVGNVLEDEAGNHYIESTESGAENWLVNCNHQADGAPAPVVEDASLYVVKYDVRIADGTAGASQAQMQIVLGDNWNWVGAGLFPESTGGKWITVTVDALSLSGALDCSTGTNGIYGGPFPAGIAIDNLRLSLK